MLNKIKLYIIKLKIYIYNFNYKIILIKSWNYLQYIYEELDNDFYLTKRNFRNFRNTYKSLSILKHILIIFFFFAGIIPIIIFLFFSFFFIKYIIKYIFLTINFFFFNEKEIEEEKHFYFRIQNNIWYIFELIPLSFKKIYKFIFKSNWTLYFINKIINYLFKKLKKIKNYFINKFDYFILIYLPRKYNELEQINWQDNLHNIYVNFMILYYKLRKKIFKVLPWKLKKIKYIITWYLKKYIFIKIYKEIIIYLFRIKILIYYYKLYVYLKKKTKLYSDKFYYWYYIYIKIKFYYIWMVKVFLISRACWVTIEAFFLVNYKNFKAYFIFFFFNLYCYMCFKFYINLDKINKVILSKNYLLFYLKNYIKFFIINKIINIQYFRMYIFIIILYFYFRWWILIFIKTDFLVDLNVTMYQTDFGDRSLNWRNLKIYQVVVKFFVKAYIWKNKLYKFIFYKIVYYQRLLWFYGNLKELIIPEFKYYFWTKVFAIKTYFYWKSYWKKYHRIRVLGLY